jgi:hypothetical protein
MTATNINTTMKYTTIFLALVLFTSCYTKNKAIRKFCTNETITVHDTVVVDHVQVDSVFSISFDTITIERDRLRLQVVRVLDSVYLQAECVGDTIYLERVVNVPIAKCATGFSALWQNRQHSGYLILMCLIVGMCIGLYFSRR